jgi:hypothetical protein
LLSGYSTTKEFRGGSSEEKACGAKVIHLGGTVVLLALNVSNSAINDLLIGLGVQCHPHGKSTRGIFANNLDAGNGFTPWPLPYRIEAFFAHGPIV